MTSFPRFPRLEQLFGTRLDALTAEHLERAISQDVREHTDLDCKRDHYDDSEKAKLELAKDVAALANARGGVILLGVDEENGKATKITPVDLDETKAAQRMNQIVAARVFPHVQLHFHPVQVGDKAGHGVLVVGVARSASAPHAFAVKPNDSLRYPIRNGTNTRFLAESEVADAYRNRFREARTQIERLDQVATEGAARLEMKDVVWLALSLVPTAPGQFPISRESVSAVHRWMAGLQVVALDGPCKLFDQGAVPSTALRRVTLAERLNHENGKARSLYAELHADGSGFAALVNWWRMGDEAPALIRGKVARQICCLIDALVTFAVEQAGASGDAVARLDVVAEKYPLRLVSNSFSVGINDEVPNSRPLASQFSIPRTISLDAASSSAREKLAVAKLVADDLMQTFGIAEIHELGPGGSLGVGSYEPRSREKVEAWAKANGVEVTEER